MAHLEGAYEQVNQRLAGLDLRLDGLDRKLESMRSELAGRIDGLRTTLDDKIDRRFTWTIGIVLTCWFTTMLGIIGILVKH